jgi:hypothetical protein
MDREQAFGVTRQIKENVMNYRSTGFTSAVRGDATLRLLLCILLLSFALGPRTAMAAVSVLDAWPAMPQLIGTNGNLSGTFTISAGSNRLLVIAVDCQDTAGSSGQTFSATYGGRPLTEAVVENSNRRQSWIGYLAETDIAGRSGDAVTVTITGTHTNVSAHIASYQGVDQTNPVTGIGSIYVNNANPGTFPAAVSVNADGYGIYTFSSNQARSSDNETYTEHSDYLNGLQMGVASRTFATSGTTQPQVTYAANARASQSLITLNPASAAGPGSIQLSSSTYSVNENGVSVLISATRTGGTTGVVGVSYATANGTATSGSDYTAASGTLSWPDGDAANKTFIVSITNDTAIEANETFTVSLSSPTGGASLGTPSTGTVSIVDDDGAPAAQVPAGNGILFAVLTGGIVFIASFRGRRKDGKTS